MGRFTSFIRPRNTADKKLFIHAGTHKTGTSFFQHAAYLNAETLRGAGVWYPETGLGIKTNHNRYAHRVLGIDIAAGKRNRFPEIIADLNQDASLHTALVSYEGFSHPQAIKKLGAAKGAFNDVDLHVILVFRPHVDLAISLYRELCQHVSFQGSLYDLMHPKTSRARHWNQCLHYQQTLKNWRRLVRKNNIHVLAYRQIKHDILKNLVTVAGYDGPLTLPDNLTRNHSLSAPFAGLMRLINRQDLNTKHRHRLANEVAAVDAGLPEFSRYCEISQDRAVELERAFTKDRKALKSYGLDPVEDLTINSNWRWGEQTDMSGAILDAHQALLEHLKNIDDKELVTIAETASKELS